MKKKMGILAGLLMATVVTGYSVGGTYAKYTSSIDLTDEARVAKWQLNLKDVNGNILNETKTINLFAESYSYEDGLYVKSLGTDGSGVAKVVAPGTAGEYQVNLSGAMETRYTIAIDFDEVNGNEPSVKYDVDENGVVTVNPENGAYTYRPITYTVSFKRTMDANETYFEHSGSLADVKAELAKYAQNPTEFEPHRMAEFIKIEWKWDAQNEVVPAEGMDALAGTEVDKLDTYIGEHWVDKAVSKDDVNYQWSLGSAASAKYQLTVTATQVAESHSKPTA